MSKRVVTASMGTAITLSTRWVLISTVADIPDLKGNSFSANKSEYEDLSNSIFTGKSVTWLADNPDDFDVTRTPNRHVAFGRGPHLCLGNHLSRIDMESIFKTLFRETTSIELLEEPQFKTGLSVRGLHALKVRLVPR